MNLPAPPVNPNEVSAMKIIPQNEVDAAFMEDLKDAISDRNSTLEEVIALVQKVAAAGYLGGDSKLLISAIHALKS